MEGAATLQDGDRRRRNLTYCYGGFACASSAHRISTPLTSPRSLRNFRICEPLVMAHTTTVCTKLDRRRTSNRTSIFIFIFPALSAVIDPTQSPSIQKKKINVTTLPFNSFPSSRLIVNRSHAHVAPAVERTYPDGHEMYTWPMTPGECRGRKGRPRCLPFFFFFFLFSRERIRPCRWVEGMYDIS